MCSLGPLDDFDRAALVSAVLTMEVVCGDNTAVADVIFIHGLTGDPIETWTNQTSSDEAGGYWPAWLCGDIPEVRCLTLGYPASVFEQWAKKEMGLFERAKSVLDFLHTQGYGSRPTILITHSLGGLLAKQLLQTAALSGKPEWKDLAARICLVVFLATPHAGTGLANALRFIFPRLGSFFANELATDSFTLQELNESYRAFASSRPIKTVVYYEKFKTKNTAIVVDAASADPGVAGTFTIPVDADHITICKPLSRKSVVYLGVLAHIRSVLPLTDTSDASRRAASDRRALLQKLIDANREYEYGHANEMQNRFARDYYRMGLHTPARLQREELLSEVEQRFLMHVYHGCICRGSTDEAILDAVQSRVIDPIVNRYGGRISSLTVMEAIYYLTEQCFLSWNQI